MTDEVMLQVTLEQDATVHYTVAVSMAEEGLQSRPEEIQRAARAAAITLADHNLGGEARDVETDDGFAFRVVPHAWRLTRVTNAEGTVLSEQA